jgi:hypothetical protein
MRALLECEVSCLPDKLYGARINPILERSGKNPNAKAQQKPGSSCVPAPRLPAIRKKGGEK